MENDLDTTFLFGDFELSAANRSLLERGETVALSSKTFDLLLFLVENHERVVTKDELLGRVWEGQFVEENNLTVQVAALRKIFGTRKENQQFIATVHGKGYKFVADVRSRAAEQRLTVRPVLFSQSQIDKSFENSKKILGRTRELSAVSTLLRDAECRLITLSGAGGSGKTLLARAISEQVGNDFPDGVFFVELASINQPEFLVAAISTALGLKETGETSPAEVLGEYLKDKRTLLVLDNFEQIISAAPIVEKLISESDLLKILTTSRVSLNSSFERDFAVLPLSFPPVDVSLSSSDLDKYPAIKLFIKKARSVRENFVFSEENSDVISGICRRLDGLPLAIELAAARVRLLSPQAIFRRLSDSLNLLSGGAKNLPERQQTMRAAIEWSNDLLDEDEKNLFRQLSVFAGGFTVEAAEAVSVNRQARRERLSSTDTASGTQGSEGRQISPVSGRHAPINVLDLLTSLVDNNLVRLAELENGDVRAQMLEVVREFAAEQLEVCGESEVLRRRHAGYFLELAAEAEPHLFGGKSIEWLTTLETEIDNLRLALDHSFETDPRSAIRLAAATRYFWIYHSHLTEGRKWLGRALDASSGEPYDLRFNLLYALAVIARIQGDYRTAHDMYRTALAEGQTAGDKKQIALSSAGLGTILQLRGDAPAARVCFEDGLRLSREIGDEYSTAYALLCLGIVLGLEGKPAQARRYLEESLEMVRRFGSQEAVSNNLNNLGAVAFDENDFAAARDYFSEGLKISIEVGNKVNIIDALNGFAALAAEENKFEEAARLSGAAENLKNSINFQQEPAELRFCETYLTKVRSALDAEMFSRAVEEGRRLAAGDAADFAFSAVSAMTDSVNEIVIETHKFERILIEEEFETDDPETGETDFIDVPKNG